jgi:hypothetical protein
VACRCQGQFMRLRPVRQTTLRCHWRAVRKRRIASSCCIPPIRSENGFGGTSNGGLVAIWIRGRRRWSSTGTATDGTPPLRATHSITHYSSHPQPSIAIVEGSHSVLFPGPVSVGVGGHHERLRRSGVLLRTALLLQRTWLASRPDC